MTCLGQAVVAILKDEKEDGMKGVVGLEASWKSS